MKLLFVINFALLALLVHHSSAQVTLPPIPGINGTIALQPIACYFNLFQIPYFCPNGNQPATTTRQPILPRCIWVEGGNCNDPYNQSCPSICLSCAIACVNAQQRSDPCPGSCSTNCC